MFKKGKSTDAVENNFSTAATDGKKSSKKGKSPFKKFKSIFKKKKSSKTKKNRSQNGNANITLVSPEISKEPSMYYSNNTDGFEVILEGKKMMYEENNDARKRRGEWEDSSNLCNPAEVSDTCEPLSDWNNFVNLLFAPNMNGIFDFVYGEGERSPNESPNRVGGHRGLNGSPRKMATQQQSPQKRQEPPPIKQIITQKSTMSLPFDESYERSAIETTLEPSPVANELGGETSEIDPYNQVKDGPIQRSKDDHTNDSFEEGAIRAPLSQGDATPVTPTRAHLHASKDREDIPDEEAYDTEFTLKFLREISNIGIMLTHFQVPEDGQEISSKVVNLTLKPGLSRGSRLLEPKLCWVDFQNALDQGTSISLLGIHSIKTSVNPDEDDNPFFTITTEKGEVHAFESPTLSERNYTVHGIRNVVAWLSYHLVMGNMASGTEMVSDLEEEQGELSGELPSLKTPVQAMNDLTHSFLD